MILRHTLLFHLLLWQCLFCQAVSVSSAAETDDDDGDEYVRVMVGFHDRQEEQEYVQNQQRRMMLRTASGKKPTTKIHYEFQKTEAVVVEVTRTELEEMKKDNKFLYIEEDFKVPLASSRRRRRRSRAKSSFQQEDEEMRRKLKEIKSYSIKMTQSDSKIDPDPSWDQQCGVYVCVVDSGVWLDNEDIPYSKGDGYVDGKEFGEAIGDEWFHPRDTSHGTGVAGVMIARGGNNKGIMGVIPQGPESSNVCMRVAKVAADGEDEALISAILQGAEWCAAEAGDKPIVINISFAAQFGTVAGIQIYQRLYEQGALVVAAAGNSGKDDFAYPAAYNSVIAVASVNEQSERSIFSQYNSRVELSAPGERIEVLRAETNTVEISDGTSIASPIVAGIAARVWSAVPRCTNTQVRLALRNSAKRLGVGVPNRLYGYGLIQAKDALELLKNSGCNDNGDDEGGSPNSEPTKPPARPPTNVPTESPSETPRATPTEMPTETPETDDDDEDEKDADPTISPTRLPTRFPTRTPNSPPTPPPTSPQDQPLNCIQTVIGNELSIPGNTFFRKGEVHCLRRGGEQAYFGLTSSNQFGFFVNGQAVWTAPADITAAAFGWIFQSDGNMLLRNSNNQNIWRTGTGGNWNSALRMSFERVWIESGAGSTLWSQTSNPGSPTPPVPFSPPTPPPTSPQDQSLNCIQTVNGDQMSISANVLFPKGELFCLRRGGGGQQAYFGLTSSNQFGLFVNGQAVWTAPADVSAAASRWIFQSDGNLLLRNSNNQNIWRSGTGGNLDSALRVSFERVWIESNTGSTLWSRPSNVVGSPTPPVPNSPPTSPPTRTPGGQSLNCMQEVNGDELSIPNNTLFRIGEVHCLRRGGDRRAYFGLTPSNQFGLFFNDQAVWTAPADISAAAAGFIFQSDGNLLLRNSNNQNIWRTGTGGNWNSALIVSFERVWIESETGSTLWSRSV